MKLYTKTVCPKCMLIKAVAKESGVQLEEVNVDNNESALEELKSLGIQSVPVLKHGDKYIVDIAEIQKIIHGEQ